MSNSVDYIFPIFIHKSVIIFTPTHLLGLCLSLILIFDIPNRKENIFDNNQFLVALKYWSGKTQENWVYNHGQNIWTRTQIPLPPIYNVIFCVLSHPSRCSCEISIVNRGERGIFFYFQDGPIYFVRDCSPFHSISTSRVTYQITDTPLHGLTTKSKVRGLSLLYI